MGNIVSLENLKKSFTGRMVFDDTSFYLQEGEKVGVIGINGTGKSTLLRMIAGIEEPDEGKVTLASNLVVRFLPQNPEFDPNLSALDSVLAATKSEHAWDMEADAKSLMTKLGITNFTQKTGVLSGGQRKRLALVSVLIASSDVLVLDEPTNHLDSEMSAYLENRLKKYRGTLVMVTHDRYFLDSVTNRIVELDKGKLYSYDENYSGFLMRKAEREASLLAAERKRQSILRKEIEWMMRGARARSTKQKAHIQRYEALRDQAAPEFDAKVELGSVATRMGRTTVELHHLSKSYGDNVLFSDFNYNFLKEDRIGFIGPNGCGKTTLMKMIVGEVQPDSGEVVIGQTIKIGYYTQEIANNPSAGVAYMDPALRVIDYIQNTARFIQTSDGMISATNMLERFLFTSETQYSPIAKLSGGEKRRLNLLRVLMEAPNVLILDEPTNDLDIATMQILEDFLDNFQGIVITVSHDRYFLDRVVRRIFAFEDGKIRQYEGGYTDVENRRREEGYYMNEPAVKKKEQTDAGASKSSNEGRTHQNKLKFSYKEQREFETIEEDIAKLEEGIAQLDTEIAGNATNSVKLMELSEKQDIMRAQLEEKMERWMYLTDLAEQIAAQNTQ